MPVVPNHNLPLETQNVGWITTPVRLGFEQLKSNVLESTEHLVVAGMKGVNFGPTMYSGERKRLACRVVLL
jgi:hypothetical protein